MDWCYSNIENLVLPPGCRPYGPEAGPGHRKLAWPLRKPWSDGILECWNTGFGGIRSFLCGWQRPENKISPAAAFDPQYSIIPWVLERPTPPLRGVVKPRLRRGLWTRIFTLQQPAGLSSGYEKHDSRQCILFQLDEDGETVPCACLCRRGWRRSGAACLGKDCPKLIPNCGIVIHESYLLPREVMIGKIISEDRAVHCFGTIFARPSYMLHRR